MRKYVPDAPLAEGTRSGGLPIGALKESRADGMVFFVQVQARGADAEVPSGGDQRGSCGLG